MRSWAEHTPTEMPDDWSRRLPPRKEWAKRTKRYHPILATAALIAMLLSAGWLLWNTRGTNGKNLIVEEEKSKGTAPSFPNLDREIASNTAEPSSRSADAEMEVNEARIAIKSIIEELSSVRSQLLVDQLNTEVGILEQEFRNWKEEVDSRTHQWEGASTKFRVLSEWLARQ